MISPTNSNPRQVVIRVNGCAHVLTRDKDSIAEAQAKLEIEHRALIRYLLTIGSSFDLIVYSAPIPDSASSSRRPVYRPEFLYVLPDVTQPLDALKNFLSSIEYAR